jgi:hypothetical protein
VDQLESTGQDTQRSHLLSHQLAGKLLRCPDQVQCRSRVRGVGDRHARSRARDVFRIPGDGVNPAQKRELNRLPVGGRVDRKRGIGHGYGIDLASGGGRHAGNSKCGNHRDPHDSALGCLRLPARIAWLALRKRMVDVMLLHQWAFPFPALTPWPVPAREIGVVPALGTVPAQAHRAGTSAQRSR